MTPLFFFISFAHSYLPTQVTIPAFLFAKIIYCPPDNSDGSNNDIIMQPQGAIVCPSVANRLSDTWMLLIWPFYVVFCGLCTGYIAAKVSKTPQIQIRSCLAACAFGNSTGLVITLLSVIHTQFNKATELGRIDSTAFLSVYLLLYPVLQWGVGGWLLAPEEKNCDTVPLNKDFTENRPTEGTPFIANDNANNSNTLHRRKSRRISHILNKEPNILSPAMYAGQEEFGGISQPNGHFVVAKNEQTNGWHTAGYVYPPSSNALETMVKELSFVDLGKFRGSDENIPYLITQTRSLNEDGGPLMIDASERASPTSLDSTNNIMPNVLSQQELAAVQETDILPLTETLHRISKKVFQPPVIGALLGLFIASFPTLRGMFENIWGNNGQSDAPLHFWFDGIKKLGEAAVPINMMILGINLSSTFQKKEPKNTDEFDKKMLPNRTMMAIVAGKMIVMPLLGIMSTLILERYFISIPDEIDATCYLVMMIVFITPTANNVMVMVELSGSSSKEGIARVIGWQYAVSPIVLSLVLSVVVSLASCHFDQSCSSLVDIRI